MSVEPTATGAPASGPASAVPAIASPALQSVRTTWSSLSRQMKVIISIAVVAFLAVAAVVAVSVVSAVASRAFGGASALRAQVASVDMSPAAQLSNRKIDDLRVTKNVGDGTVRVQFTLKGSPEGGPIAAGRFLVRIFDANGSSFTPRHPKH